MRIIRTIREMQQQAEAWRRSGEVIVLVPTMGYFHAGHLALMRHARSLGTLVGVSLFVNPTQFAPTEDLTSYPRDFDRDRRLAEEVGVDFMFVPEAGAMYPSGFQTQVEVTELTRPLCGATRPTHFRGVTTVVAKLFNIVKPHAAVFGRKDYQQLMAVQRMVRDLNMEVTVVGHPIVREADGLAMSSRNQYLTPDQRRRALVLSAALDRARQVFAGGEVRSAVLIEGVREAIGKVPEVRLDYAELRDPETMAALERIDRPALLAIAAFVGKARLLDNVVLTPSA
ncbi:MAG: pantoate--beta-alanine ligase [Syntrophobacteraceae bacterium CG2_30_61_12]|nr:MAG: pantoate--beta-alanine ligase [Syntrophobacteraceae bacterium CG2_30_61_12]